MRVGVRSESIRPPTRRPRPRRNFFPSTSLLTPYSNPLLVFVEHACIEEARRAIALFEDDDEYEDEFVKSKARRRLEGAAPAALQTFALQTRISGVFITLVWGIIPTRLLLNMEDDGSG